MSNSNNPIIPSNSMLSGDSFQARTIQDNINIPLAPGFRGRRQAIIEPKPTQAFNGGNIMEFPWGPINGSTRRAIPDISDGLTKSQKQALYTVISRVPKGPELDAFALNVRDSTQHVKPELTRRTNESINVPYVNEEDSSQHVKPELTRRTVESIIKSPYTLIASYPKLDLEIREFSGQKIQIVKLFPECIPNARSLPPESLERYGLSSATINRLNTSWIKGKSVYGHDSHFLALSNDLLNELTTTFDRL